MFMGNISLTDRERCTSSSQD